jgi:Tfp pilus assembly protein PilZ
MNPQSQEATPQRSATRAPVEKPIKLQFDDSMEVVEGLCRNVSIGGMFIQVAETRPQGSLVRFELALGDDAAIRGLGEVVWMRARDAGDRQAGIGIKFRFLEQRDRQLIFKLVSQHIKERLARKKPEEPEAAAAKPAGAAPAGPPSEPPAPVQSPRPQPPPAQPPPAQPPPVQPSPPRTAEPRAAGDVAFDAELDQLEEAPGLGAGSLDDTAAGAAEENDETLSRLTFTPGVDGEGYADEGYVEEPPVWEGDRAQMDRMEDPREPAAWEEQPLAVPSGRRRPKLLPIVVVGIAVVVGAVYLLWPSSSPPPLPSPAPEVADGGAIEPDVTEPDVTEPDVTEPDVTEPATTELGATEPAATPPPSPEPSPPPPPRREPSPPPPERTAPAPFERLLEISWSEVPRGLKVVLETDGAVPEGRYRHFRLGGDEPREVIRLIRVRRGFDRRNLSVGGPAVDRIRTGYHRRGGVEELHVVLDLTGAAYQLTELRAVGTRIEAVIVRP